VSQRNHGGMVINGPWKESKHAEPGVPHDQA
jgi:hypothetical protein